MAGVFVSYAREDSAKAKAIARELAQAPFDVWVDDRIHSGSEFSREIEQALATASAVVVLWSKDSINSPWVRDEAAEGRDSGRLVAVTLDGCRPPIGFRQFQVTDLSRWSGRGRPKQLDDVIEAVGAKAGARARPPAKPGRTTSLKRPVAWAGAGLATLALGVAAFLFVGHTGSEPTSAPSLAILPFTADASDAESRKLASAAREAVANTLAHGAFAVSTVDSSSMSDRPADFLISGQVTSMPDKFVTAVRMEETAHHFVVFSQQFEASRDKAGDFAELIGAQVAAQLSWTAPLLAVERRHPSDPSIVASLLQSSVAGADNVATLHDYETSRRLAAKAPDSPLAQNSFAFNTAFALALIPREERAEAVAAARRAAERTIEIAPEFGGAHIPWCLLHSEQRMAECEEHLRAGIRADPDNAFDNFFLARLMLGVGRIRDATTLATLSLAHDPYMPLKIAQALRTLETSGRTPEAADLYNRSKRWWPDNEGIIWHRLSGMVLRGDLEAAQRFATELGGLDKPSPVLLAANRGSLPALRTACAAAQDIDQVLCMLALARFGDLDAAYAWADRLFPSRRGRTSADEERIWLDEPETYPLFFLTAPVAAPLRRDPRYLGLAERVGLIEYWRSGRPPDFCRDHPEPICPRLRGRA